MAGHRQAKEEQSAFTVMLASAGEQKMAVMKIIQKL